MSDPSIMDRIANALPREELIALTADLVRINSVWDPAAGTSEQFVAEYVRDWARAQGFSTRMDRVAQGRPNVIITWTPNPGLRCLMFEGHSDVVTPGDPRTWRHDPFGAEIVGRRMYGRGTNDTKGNLAAMLMAMAALKRARAPLKGCLLGGVLCDEEDQMLGVQDFIRRGHADAVTGAVICEPQDGMLCTRQKGALRARFAVTGRMAHGAMPLTGLNSAPAVARIIQGLQRLESAAVERYGQDPHLGWPSFTPTVIQAPAAGPAQLNVMPAAAEILADLRTLPAQSHEEVIRDLKALAREVEREVKAHYEDYDARLRCRRPHDLRIAVEILTDRPCTVTDPEDPLVQAARRAMESIWNQPPDYGGVPGATDGTFLWALKNIPIVTTGAGDCDVPHQIDEWIDLDQLFDMARIYALTALNYLGPQPP
ncbi:MAG: M20/M25/M40 family metallo-hydrolase [Desulfobacterales bacterium]